MPSLWMTQCQLTLTTTHILDDALHNEDLLHLIHQQTSPSNYNKLDEEDTNAGAEADTNNNPTPSSDDDFCIIGTRPNDNPNEVVITATSTCHWAIFEVPVLEPTKPTTVAQYVLDILNAASEKDPTFVIIQTDLSTDSLIGTT